MLKKILKPLIATLGGGILFGAGMRLGKGTLQSAAPPTAGDLNPLLDRLDAMESRIGRAESGTLSESRAADLLSRSLDPIQQALSAHGADVEQLRIQIESVDRRNSEQIAGLSKKIDSIEREMPLQIDLSVRPHLKSLEEKLRQSFEDMQTRTLDTFVQTLENKVLSRISLLENAVAEQSDLIHTVRQRSETTDANLEKMLTAIEKLGRTNGQGYPAFA